MNWSTKSSNSAEAEHSSLSNWDTQHMEQSVKILYRFELNNRTRESLPLLTSVKSVLSCRADEQSTKGTRVTNVAINWNVIYMKRNEVQRIRLEEKHKKIKRLDMSQKWKAPCTCWSHLGLRLVKLLWAGAACELAPQESAPRPTLDFVQHRSCSLEWLSAGGAPLRFPERDMFYDTQQ